MSAVKQGYKQTEIGIIPNDWEVKILGEVAEILRNYSNPRSDLISNGDLKYIHYGDIHKKYTHYIDFSKHELPSIKQNKLPEKIDLVKDGDLILVDVSEDYEGIAKSVEIKNLNFPTVAGLHTFLIRFSLEVFRHNYKGYIFYNPSIHKNLKKLSTGISVLGISKASLLKLQIPVPPLPEQEKIAEILNTWDESIEILQSLITQKQNLKKGLMQILLTPKIRFKGFTEKWQIKTLGEMITYKNGKSFEKHTVENGDYNLVTLNSIDIKGRLKNEHKKININDNSLNAGDLVMVLSDVAHGDFLGLTDIIPNDKYVLNQRMGGLRVSKEINPFFLKRYINFHQYYFKLMGQGSSQLNLSKGDILKFQVKVPTLPEQKKIAEVLSTVDEEIELLETKLKAIQTQKKGLMQKLLTGQTRVKL